MDHFKYSQTHDVYFSLEYYEGGPPLSASTYGSTRPQVKISAGLIDLSNLKASNYIEYSQFDELDGVQVRNPSAKVSLISMNRLLVEKDFSLNKKSAVLFHELFGHVFIPYNYSSVLAVTKSMFKPKLPNVLPSGKMDPDNHHAILGETYANVPPVAGSPAAVIEHQLEIAIIKRKYEISGKASKGEMEMEPMPRDRSR